MDRLPFSSRTAKKEILVYAYRVHDDSLTGRHDRGAIRENMHVVRERHLKRLRCFRRPFRVFLLYEDECGAPYEWAETLACSLEQQGQRVSLVRIGGASPDGSEIFPATNALDIGEAAAQVREASATNAEKLMLLSFLKAPSQAARVAASSPTDRTFSYVWLLSGVGSKREPPARGWLLCGSAKTLDALPAKRRREASLLIPSRGAFQAETVLALKARGSRYTVPELGSSTRPVAVYAGPLRADLLDVGLVLSAAEQHPDLDFILVGSDSEALGGDARLGRPDNLLIFAGTPTAKWNTYLSRAAFLCAPFRQEPALADAMQDVLLLYLAACKPVLTTDAVRTAGFADMPNAVIVPPDQFAAGVRRILDVSPNWRIADDYRSIRGPDAIAGRLIRTANAQLFVSNKPIRGNSNTA